MTRNLLLTITLCLQIIITGAAHGQTLRPHYCLNDRPDTLYHQLHYGISWFHGNQPQQRATCRSGTPGKPNPFFNPHRNHSFILIHGWHPATVAHHWRLNLDPRELTGPDIANMGAAWMGQQSLTRPTWNFGVFYWNQFSDEVPEKKGISGMLNALAVVENKIHHHTGDKTAPIRWKDDKNQLHTSPSQTNMATLFYQQYRDTFQGYHGEIRLAGQSLGAELLLSAAVMIAEHAAEDHIPLPQQIILLDPVFTKQKIPSLSGNTPLHLAEQQITTLKKAGILVIGIRTSLSGDNWFVGSNTRALNKTLFSEITPCPYPVKAIQKRHTTSVWWYLLSYGLSGIPIDDTLPGMKLTSAPYAATDYATLKAIAEHPRYRFTSRRIYNRLHFCSDKTKHFKANIARWKDWQMTIKYK